MQDAVPPTLPRLTSIQTVKSTVRILARAPLFFLATSAIQLIPEPSMARLGYPLHAHWYSEYVPVLISQILLDLTQAAVLHRAMRVLTGAPASLGETLAVGARRALPVLAVSLIQIVVGAVGLALLIVPGLYVAAALMVAGPLCLEGAPPLSSLQQSWTMTRGVRWRIVGAFLLLWLPYLIFAFGVGVYNGFSEHQLFYQRYIVGAGAIVLSAVTDILPAVVYQALQGEQRRDHLAKVFA